MTNIEYALNRLRRLIGELEAPPYMIPFTQLVATLKNTALLLMEELAKEGRLEK